MHGTGVVPVTDDSLQDELPRVCRDVAVTSRTGSRHGDEGGASGPRTLRPFGGVLSTGVARPGSVPNVGFTYLGLRPLVVRELVRPPDREQRQTPPSSEPADETDDEPTVAQVLRETADDDGRVENPLEGPESGEDPERRIHHRSETTRRIVVHDAWPPSRPGNGDATTRRIRTVTDTQADAASPGSASGREPAASTAGPPEPPRTREAAPMSLPSLTPLEEGSRRTPTETNRPPDETPLPSPTAPSTAERSRTRESTPGHGDRPTMTVRTPPTMDRQQSESHGSTHDDPGPPTPEQWNGRSTPGTDPGIDHPQQRTRPRPLEEQVDVNRLVDRLYGELERKMRVERERRGL